MSSKMEEKQDDQVMEVAEAVFILKQVSEKVNPDLDKVKAKKSILIREWVKLKKLQGAYLRITKQSVDGEDALEYVDKIHNEVIALADAIIGGKDKVDEKANRAMLKSETRIAD